MLRCLLVVERVASLEEVRGSLFTVCSFFSVIAFHSLPCFWPVSRFRQSSCFTRTAQAHGAHTHAHTYTHTHASKQASKQAYTYTYALAAVDDAAAELDSLLPAHGCALLACLAAAASTTPVLLVEALSIAASAACPLVQEAHAPVVSACICVYAGVLLRLTP
jgi:hypothetical protein